MFKVVNEFGGGTSLIGHIRVSYAQLFKVFGEPQECDGYKVSGEWTLKDHNGTIITIYDWKCTSLYDEEYPSVSDFRNNTTPQIP